MSRPVRIPSYRLHKPSKQAIVAIRGRMFYLGPYGSAESRAEYGRIIAEWQSGPPEIPPASPTLPAAPADLTVAELFRSYFRHCQQYYVKDGKVTNQVTMIHLALQVATRLYGHTMCRDFGPVALKACRAEFIREGLSRGECNRRTNLIRQAFRWGTENELIPAGIFHALQSVAGLRKGRSEARETTPVGPVADEVVDRTLEHLGPTMAAMVALQRVSGMRPQEVVGIRAIDIDMADPTCWAYRPGAHKTEHHDRDRVIFLGGAVAPVPRVSALSRGFSPMTGLESAISRRGTLEC